MLKTPHMLGVSSSSSISSNILYFNFQHVPVELKESKSNEISVLRHSFIGADERKLSMMEVNYRRTRPK